MPSLPLTLLSLHPCSHASCLPWLAFKLPLVLRRLSFLSRHHLLSSGASTCPPLVTPLPLVLPLFFSGAVASCLPRLFVVSPLVTLLPSLYLRLRLSLHCHLSLQLSHAIWPAGCLGAFHHANASRPPAPPTLVAPLHLVASLLCPFYTLAGCQVDPMDHPEAHCVPHISPTHLPSWKPHDSM